MSYRNLVRTGVHSAINFGIRQSRKVVYTTIGVGATAIALPFVPWIGAVGAGIAAAGGSMLVNSLIHDCTTKTQRYLRDTVDRFTGFPTQDERKATAEASRLQTAHAASTALAQTQALQTTVQTLSLTLARQQVALEQLQANTTPTGQEAQQREIELQRLRAERLQLAQQQAAAEIALLQAHAAAAQAAAQAQRQAQAVAESAARVERERQTTLLLQQQQQAAAAETVRLEQERQAVAAQAAAESAARIERERQTAIALHQQQLLLQQQLQQQQAAAATVASQQAIIAALQKVSLA